jgi:Uma2 family endonuclease
MSALRAAPYLLDDDEAFLRAVPSDTPEAPWMVMNDRQIRGATALYWSLRIYAQTHGLPWYVGSMLALLYRRPGMPRRKKVAPDVLVAFIPDRPRDSLDTDVEGMPPFVLEVVSKTSVKRDLEEKERIYRLLGAQEYAIVRLDAAQPRLEGYRVDERGRWVRWMSDEQGRLRSAVLGLWLTLEDDEVRAQTPSGEPLRTPLQLEVARQNADAALNAAEQEVARLRAEVERLSRE